MDETVKYYRRTYKILEDLTFIFRNGYDKKEILNFYKNCFIDYNYNSEIFRRKKDGLMLTVMISLLGINKESIENTNKFLEYNNSVIDRDYRSLIYDNKDIDKLNEFNERYKSTDFDNWLSIKNCPDIDKFNADIIRRVRNCLLHGNFTPEFNNINLSYTRLKTKSYYEAIILNQNFYQFVCSYFSNFPGSGLCEFTNLNYTTYIGKIKNEKNLREFLKGINIFNFYYNLNNYDGKNSLEYLLFGAEDKKYKEFCNVLKNSKENGINIKDIDVCNIPDEQIENIIKYFKFKYGKHFYNLDNEKQKTLISSYVDFLYNNKKHISFWLIIYFHMINHCIDPEHLVNAIFSSDNRIDIESIKPSLSILKAYLILYRLQYEGFEKVNYEDINFNYDDRDFCIWSEKNNQKTDEDYFIESYNKKYNKDPNFSDKYIKNQILCEMIRNGLSHGNINILMNDNFEIYIEIKDIDKKRNKARCIQMSLSKFNKFLNSEAFLPKNCISLDKDINNKKIRRRK